MEQISAYYQCYKNREALNFVLSQFRNFYPTNKIILVCDGGLDFSKESHKYNCDYFYEKKVDSEKNLIFKNVKSLTEFILRIKKYTENIKSKYLLLLEDDVITMNKITEEDLIYDINGCNFNEFLNKNLFLNDDLYYFGGCGGSILNLNFFKKIFNNEKQLLNDIIFFYENSEKQDIASDRLLSFLCYKNNGSIGQYKGFCETWYENYQQRLKNKNIEILHQYKNLYK